MRILSTKEERRTLLERLHSAPDTEEIRSAIRIVEEAESFSKFRDLVVKVYSSPNSPDTFEEIIESRYMNPEMRPLGNAIDELYNEQREQRFKDFFITKTDKGDEDWQVI